jgi:hypothetical protein
MSADSSSTPDVPSHGQHLATVSHDGRFWDVYLEFEDDPRRPNSYRGLLAYSPADRNEGEETLRTTSVIIEPSYEEAVRKARKLEDHQLVAFLRSLLP